MTKLVLLKTYLLLLEKKRKPSVQQICCYQTNEYSIHQSIQKKTRTLRSTTFRYKSPTCICTQKTLYKDMLYTSSPQNNLMLRKELDVYNFVLQVLQNSLRSSIQDCPTDARKEKKNIYEILVNTFIKKLMRSININCSLNATIC